LKKVKLSAKLVVKEQNMKIGDYEFNLRELSGAMGDYGTLFPLAIGYIVVCGMDPAGMLLMLGLANIITGIVYKLPMPIEPMKVLAVIAIAEAWPPSLIYASAFGMGIIWLLMAMTGLMTWVSKITPKCVVRGIQVSLGAMLALQAFSMLSSWWLLGIISIVIVLLLRENRYAPAALVLILLGVAIMFFQGDLQKVTGINPRLPTLQFFTLGEVWQALVLAGFAQVPLTATNAVISTSSLIKTYWPKKAVSERKLSLNMGTMNLVAPFFGGMPMCHGAGGLAGQYYFGARTGGANIMEGAIYITLGSLLASSIASLFDSFPTAIIGAMMFLIGLEMVKFVRDVPWQVNELLPLGVTVALSLVLNMAVGFLAGVCMYYLIKNKVKERTEHEKI
jgi:MFS superfamily sulfate permease-like transporter